MLDKIESYLLALQHQICNAFELLDGCQHFKMDRWKREGGGGGVSAVLEGGEVFERAGVNFSRVHGDQLPPSATIQRPELAGCDFEALGLSMVIHPRNPYAPTMHANLRYFEANTPKEPVWWFGGGFDLTPYYGFDEDCQHWHQMAYDACQPFGEALYQQLKTQCDQYFFLKHRHEPRGIGGIFFDDLNQWPIETCFSFVKSVGDHLLPAYLPIIKRRHLHEYGERERHFQCYRRGRYVEFNLIYDRGTLFGLQSGGRTESILMSLPPVVEWRYDWQPELDSPEELLYRKFLKPKDWLQHTPECL